MNQLHRFLAAAGVVCLPVFGMACDLCSCAGGGNSLGLLPLVNRHFAGFRGQSQAFHTDAHGSEPNSHEYFRSLDIWGRWQPHRRLQLIGSLPFQFSERRFDDGKYLKTKGLGDATLLAQAALLDPRKQFFKTWRHTLQLGVGVKLPTGKTNFRDSEGEKNEVLQPALQPGTGSTDFLLSGLYALRRGDWGASLDGTFRLTGKNAEGYRFGKRLNAGFRGFWTKKVGKTTLMPYLGGLLDSREKDFDGDERQTDTGGWAAFGMVGAEVFRGDVALNFGWQMPLASDMASGRITPQPRFNASAVLLFGGKKDGSGMDMPEVFQNAKK